MNGQRPPGILTAWRGVAWDRWDAAALGLATAAFLWLVAGFWEYTMDDSFITARYADHWASGHGIVWNIGEDPVEGATSFLWLAILTAILLVGAPLILTANVLSILVVLAAAVGIYAQARASNIHRLLAIMPLGAILVNPLIAFHATTGMETVTGLALLSWTALLATWTLRSSGPVRQRHHRWMAIAAFLTVLARPDALAFVAPLYVGIWIWTWRHDRRGVPAILRDVALLNLVPGIAYMAWRIWYFGHLFPNPFYVKTGSQNPTVVANEIATTLAMTVGALLLLLSLQDRRQPAHSPDAEPVPSDRDADRTAGWILLAASTLFLVSTFQAAPIMAFLGRYQLPVMGAAALGLTVLLPAGKEPVHLPFGVRRPIAGTVLVAVLMLTAPVALLGPTQAEYDAISSPDRIEAGLALAALDLPDVRLYTSEAGALPYLTGWHTKDHGGLNDEVIAHHGFTLDVIEAQQPDVVMLHQGAKGIRNHGSPADLFAWLAENDYELVSIDPDTRERPYFHAYLVASESPHRQALVCAILDFETTPHARDGRLDVFAFPHSVDAAEEDCP